jgi:glycerol-3-phosphate acyltransferase PlsY
LVLWEMPALVLVLGYLLGSIPFGLVLTRLAGAGDLRAIGSGNIGATNVLRTGRKGLAAATLLLDGAKGAVAVAVGAALLPGKDVLFLSSSGAAAAGVMAFLGHCYPVWLRFRGGKGVATMLGVCLALHWPAGLVFAAVWLGMLGLTRMSSAGGVSGALSVPVFTLFMGPVLLFPAFAAMALILIWRHRANIGRILQGREPRVGQSGAASGPTAA